MLFRNGMQSNRIYKSPGNMTNSTVLLDRGIRCLNNELGIIDAERFVALILTQLAILDLQASYYQHVAISHGGLHFCNTHIHRYI